LGTQLHDQKHVEYAEQYGGGDQHLSWIMCKNLTESSPGLSVEPKQFRGLPPTPMTANRPRRPPRAISAPPSRPDFSLDARCVRFLPGRHDAHGDGKEFGKSDAAIALSLMLTLLFRPVVHSSSGYWRTGTAASCL